MFFRLTYLAKGARLEFKRDKFRFEIKEPLPIEVSLQPPGTEFPEPTQPGDVLCRLDVEKEPDANVRSMFEQLSRGQLPDDYDSPIHQHPPGIVDEKGNQTKLMPSLVFMPKPFRDFVDKVYPPMTEAATRIFDLLRWRFNRHGAGFRHLWDGHTFSFDKQAWHNMPSILDPTGTRLIDSFTYAAFGEADAYALTTEFQSGSAEPLGHVLLREAWGLRFQSSRGSMLIGFTAAEAGVKRHIVRMMPTTKNLLMPMPSPPIKRLLDYIDEIPPRSPRVGRGKLIPPSIRKTLDQMGELRNKIGTLVTMIRMERNSRLTSSMQS